jgi:hypothetical protein
MILNAMKLPKIYNLDIVKMLRSCPIGPLYAAICRLRDWAYAEVNHLYPAPENALLAGILLGIDSDLPNSLAHAF